MIFEKIYKKVYKRINAILLKEFL